MEKLTTTKHKTNTRTNTNKRTRTRTGTNGNTEQQRALNTDLGTGCSSGASEDAARTGQPDRVGHTAQGGITDLDRRLNDIHERLIEQDRWIRTEFDELEVLQGLSRDSFVDTDDAVNRLEELALLSDEGEHDITVIHGPGQGVGRSSPVSDDSEKRLGPATPSEGLPTGSEKSKVVRQQAMDSPGMDPVGTAPIDRSEEMSGLDITRSSKGANTEKSIPLDEVAVGRTKEEKARNGTRKSLIFLKKMGQRDSSSITVRERQLIRKHRRDVRKFEKIYGSTKDLLKGDSPETVGTGPAGASRKTPFGVKGTTADPVKAAKNDVVGVSGTVPTPDRITDPAPEKPTTSRNASGTRIPPSSTKGGEKLDSSRGGLSARGTTAKRARSGDEPSLESKKVKPSSSSGRPDHRQYAVIDRSDQDGKISVDHWQLIEGMLIDRIAVFKGERNEISFKGADWSKGVKIVNCGNEKSARFLTETVEGLGELWPGAKLEVVPSSCLPLRSMVTVWIPPPIRPVETILSVLEKQNEELLTSQWKLVASMACKGNQGRDFRFAVDPKSLARLRFCEGAVNFGLGKIRFRLPKPERT